MKEFTATVQREGDLFVSHCVELDIASQGASQGEALENLKEAVELFLETASASEKERHTLIGAPANLGTLGMSTWKRKIHAIRVL
jgi:predicted RNase H-like HicB family nuclease